MIGNNGIDKENEKKTESGIEKERGGNTGEIRSKSREGRVGLLNTKAYLDRRLLHLGPREKVCWQQPVKMIHSLEFELPKRQYDSAK